MKNTKVIIVGSFAAAMAIGAVSISVASADIGGKHKAVREAIRNNDFEAFIDARDESPVLKNVDTKREFTALALSYDLRQDGKYKESREVLERAGIEHPGIRHDGQKNAIGIRQAVQNNDWSEFQEISKDKQIHNIINSEEKFDLFVEMHELRKDNRFKEAEKIQKELKLYGNRYMK